MNRDARDLSVPDYHLAPKARLRGVAERSARDRPGIVHPAGPRNSRGPATLSPMPIRRKRTTSEATATDAPETRRGRNRGDRPAASAPEAPEAPTSDERYAEAAHTIRDHDEEW